MLKKKKKKDKAVYMQRNEDRINYIDDEQITVIITYI